MLQGWHNIFSHHKESLPKKKHHQHRHIHQDLTTTLSQNLHLLYQTQHSFSARLDFLLNCTHPRKFDKTAVHHRKTLLKQYLLFSFYLLQLFLKLIQNKAMNILYRIIFLRSFLLHQNDFLL